MANILEKIKKRIQLSRLRKCIVPIVVGETPKLNPDNGEGYLNWVPRKCGKSLSIPGSPVGNNFSKK